MEIRRGSVAEQQQERLGWRFTRSINIETIIGVGLIFVGGVGYMKSLESDHQIIRAEISEVAGQVQANKDDIDRLESSIDRQYNEIIRRLERLDSKIDHNTREVRE